MNTKSVVSWVVGAVIGLSVATTYIMKHPDQDDIKSVSSSWLSAEEKDGAIRRIVALGCDKRFRDAFIQGTLVIPTGEEESIIEKSDAYIYLSKVVVVNKDKGFRGGYLCSYYKDGREPFINSKIEEGVSSLLKK